jgi:hypothetical protein
MTSFSGVLCSIDTNSKPWKLQKLQASCRNRLWRTSGRSRGVPEPVTLVVDAHLLPSKCSLTDIIRLDFRNTLMIDTTTDRTLESRTQYKDKMADMNQRW